MSDAHRKRFEPSVYFLYNDTLHRWLSERNTWTMVFWEARVFHSFEAVIEAFESEELPEGAKYYDCEIFATQGVWVKAPEENHHSRRDRKP